MASSPFSSRRSDPYGSLRDLRGELLTRDCRLSVEARGRKILRALVSHVSAAERGGLLRLSGARFYIKNARYWPRFVRSHTPHGIGVCAVRAQDFERCRSVDPGHRSLLRARARSPAVICIAHFDVSYTPTIEPHFRGYGSRWLTLAHGRRHTL